MPNIRVRWDVFCKIVDNYGDIGVCWRLVKQLVQEHHLQVQLWVDDLHIAKKIIPELDVAQNSQVIEGVRISHWQENTRYEMAAEVVIEAFGCGLPASYLAKMNASSVWVNLEYLSAENWVADFHGRHAVHDALKRYFYFPGFTPATGGLIRESHLSIASNHQEGDTLKVSLFCYQSAPVRTLLLALSKAQHKTTLFLPVDDYLQRYADIFGEAELLAGDTLTLGALTVNVLPFLSQEEYDELLRSCDVNFVRGEDSWVRGIWAGKPMIWQPYVQEEGTHFDKLNAFLGLFYADCEVECGAIIRDIYIAWSDGRFNAAHWDALFACLPAWQECVERQNKTLFKQPDLASKLVIFCNNL
jgi:uncharacterized repeat protein (TIGR03837 family)